MPSGVAVAESAFAVGTDLTSSAAVAVAVAHCNLRIPAGHSPGCIGRSLDCTGYILLARSCTLAVHILGHRNLGCIAGSPRSLAAGHIRTAGIVVGMTAPLVGSYSSRAGKLLVVSAVLLHSSSHSEFFAKDPALARRDLAPRNRGQTLCMVCADSSILKSGCLLLRLLMPPGPLYKPEEAYGLRRKLLLTLELDLRVKESEMTQMGQL